MAEIESIPVEQIVAGQNDRSTFDPAALEELAQSIRDHGLAQPITVRPIWRNGGQQYEIVAGERRYRAISTILHLPTIDAIVRHLDDEQAAGIMLAENVNRVDLNPMDEARAYGKRMEQFQWSTAQTAKRANVSEGRVKSRLALLTLRPEAQKLVQDGHLPLGLAEEMSSLDNNRQLIALRWLQQQPGMPTRRAFAEVVGKLYTEQCQESLFDIDSLFQPMVVQAVEEGRHIGQILPTRGDLPELDTKAKTVGELVDRYLSALLDSGKTDEASVVCDLFAKLADLNWARISPYDSQTLRKHADVFQPHEFHTNDKESK